MDRVEKMPDWVKSDVFWPNYRNMRAKIREGATLSDMKEWRFYWRTYGLHAPIFMMLQKSGWLVPA